MHSEQHTELDNLITMQHNLRNSAKGSNDAYDVSVSLTGDGGDWISGPGGGVEKVGLNRKTPAHLARHGILGIQSRPRVLEETEGSGSFRSVSC